MIVNIPKVVVPKGMEDYAPDLKGLFLYVWVNPPLDILAEHLMLVAEIKSEDPTTSTGGGLLDWYARLWSQGVSTETHWTVEELRELEMKDPAFLSWMITTTWEARRDHLERKKKA